MPGKLFKNYSEIIVFEFSVFKIFWSFEFYDRVHQKRYVKLVLSIYDIVKKFSEILFNICRNELLIDQLIKTKLNSETFIKTC